MASHYPPKKNIAFTVFVSLVSQSNTKLFQANPTLAAGDVKVSIDGGAFNNLATLPVVTPASGRAVQVDLSTSEMNGDNIIVTFVDAAGAEWCDLMLCLQTTARLHDDLAYPTTTGRSIDVATTGEVGLDFDNVKQATGATTLTNIRVPNVTLTDTVTTYTGNTVQTGDSFARIGAAGVSLSAIPDESGVTTLLSRLTSGRATNLDNLDTTVSTRATPAQILTTALTEAYAADGAAPTLAQLLFLLLSVLTDFTINATTLTAHKLDGSTTSATFTLNDAVAPTGITRAT